MKSNFLCNGGKDITNGIICPKCSHCWTYVCLHYGQWHCNDEYSMEQWEECRQGRRPRTLKWGNASQICKAMEKIIDDKWNINNIGWIMNQHLSPSLNIKGCDLDEHPIRKNCRKSALVQTFWNGVLKLFNLFVNKMFKRGKRFQVVFNCCWKGEMLELTWTNFFYKTNTMIKQKPKGQGWSN